VPDLTFTNGDDFYQVLAAGQFTLNFLAGADTLDVRHEGAEVTAHMGEGNDLIIIRAGWAAVEGEGGSDRFDIYGGGASARGGEGDDLFYIRGGSNYEVLGGIGNDRFNFLGGADVVTVDGGDGNDDFYGYNHPITALIYGGEGADYFVGFFNADGRSVSILGGIGNDIYRADPTSPAIFVEFPGEGSDAVQVARGASYTLADNIERISVQGFSGSNLTAAATLVGNAISNSITGHNNVETIHGLDGADRLFGKGGNDLIFGGQADDYVDGGDGADTLYGDDGNDTLNGRAGMDNMVGGNGDDVYYVDNGGDLVTEAAGGGEDTVRLSVSFYGLAPNIENGIQSGSADLDLSGNVLDNELIGNSGNSILHGLDGNDVLRGGAGDDILDAGDGDDLLVGGLGADMLAGGLGSDVFKYYSVQDSTLQGGDFLTEFTVEDFLNLSSIDADSTQAGNQSFSWSGGPSVAGALWIYFEEDGSTSLYGDVDGDHLPDLYISIGTSTFDSSHIIL